MKPFADLRRYLPDLTMPQEPVRPGIAWTMRHLRPGFLASAVLLVLGAPAGYLISGWPGVWGAVTGLAIVTLFFAISTWLVVLAGRRDDRLTLPAVLIGFSVKVVLLGVLLVAIPRDGPIDVVVLAWSVLIGALVWMATQIHFVVRQRMFYVDYHPPGDIDD